MTHSDTIVSSLASVPHFERIELGTVCLAVALPGSFNLQGNPALRHAGLL